MSLDTNIECFSAEALWLHQSLLWLRIIILSLTKAAELYQGLIETRRVPLNWTEVPELE